LIKVSVVASRLDTMATRDMIEALIAGEGDPQRPGRSGAGPMKAKRHKDEKSATESENRQDRTGGCGFSALVTCVAHHDQRRSELSHRDHKGFVSRIAALFSETRWGVPPVEPAHMVVTAETTVDRTIGLLPVQGPVRYSTR
jgi:hypothetical protein